MGVTYTERVALLDGSFLVVAVVVAVVLARHHWSGNGRDVMTLMLKAIERNNEDVHQNYNSKPLLFAAHESVPNKDGHKSENTVAKKT